MRPDDRRYFEDIEADLEAAVAVASRARERGGDPVPEIEIPTARDMADRVENILGIDGVAARVREFEGEHSREEAALALVTDFVDGTVGDYDTRAGKIEGAVRTAVALLTEGVVAAPIEGIDRVEVLTNDDGTEFVNVYYAGPIRSAGGTAQALSVLVADYARSLLGIEEYKPRDAEVERYAEEVALYDDDTGLQYSPTDEETRFIAEHLPIMLDGEPTGDEEVAGYRDLDRVDTNNPRGGMCLVLAEGIAQKAPKIQRYTRDLPEVDWPWLQDLIDGSYAGAAENGPTDVAGAGVPDDPADAAAASADTTGPPRPAPSEKFLRDLIAGRPVFAHPSEPGGFRLRYGRARNHGFATAGVHPATMHLVDDFLAAGTQLKTERPGKAAGVVPVDSIDGPTVKLANGDVRRVDDPAEAIEIRNGVDEILDLGEYLVNYGEFVENNQPLAPAAYAVEWWVADLAAAGADVQALADDPDVDLEAPDADRALAWAEAYDAPLHPAYTYCWHDVSVADVDALATAVEEGEFAASDGAAVERTGAEPGDTLVLAADDTVRHTLERLLVEHHQGGETLTVPDARPLLATLGFDADLHRDWTLDTLSPDARTYDGGDDAIEAVNEVAPFAVRERGPTRVGSRMGRPEKSEERELSPAVHTLFPLGDAGGPQRDVAGAAEYAEAMNDRQGRVEVTVARRRCTDCGEQTYRSRCPDCGGVTEPRFECPDCGGVVDQPESGRATCPRCDVEARPVERRELDVKAAYREALRSVGEREAAFDVLKGVKGLTSAEKVPEPMEKGVLRAKHGVSAFKDGTVRYDMTDLPVTAVRPRELDVSVDRMRELGYESDVHGEPLRHDDQLVELKVQDVVLSDGAAAHMERTAAFVDDLLEQYYGMEPFYDLEDRSDLVGELVFGMAPHTSAAVVGRVVGFTSASVGYAHPYFHAAKRRNCFHPETKVRVEEGGEWQTACIEDVVEQHMDDVERDDFGTLVSEVDGELRVPSVTHDGETVLRPVEAVSKHPSPDHLIEFETDSGRTVTVTPQHSMLRWDGGLTRVPASELSEGDTVPVAVSDGDLPVSRIGADMAYPDGGTVELEGIDRVRIVESDVEFTYCLSVEDTHSLVANHVYTGQCDGDEDCVMLLLDGLLNFSKTYLPDQRGGRMDAPLVMSSRIDPGEIDHEAHNIDVVESYPREFYEATREMADPDEVDIALAGDAVGTDEEYRGFGHTHDTADIAAGPDLSAYKTLGSMMEKMDAQLELARTLRAVDETDVAERVIEYHFLPDLIGNLRAFSRQETRCLDCGEKYRRMPLTADCRVCGGDVNLTVHEGSVDKYLETATRVADEFGCREYTKQRLEILSRAIESIFEDDTNKQSGIGDFM